MWSLIQSFSGYYGLVNLGLASAIQRFISRDLSGNEQASLQRTVGTAILFFLCTGVLVLIAAATLAGPAAHFFKIPEQDTPIFGITLLFCATAVVTDFFGALMSTLFTARERFDLSNGLNIARQLFQSTGILLALYYHPTMNAIALVVCAGSLSALVVSWRMAGGLYPDIRLTWLGADQGRLKELLHYGSSTVVLTISNIVRLRLGNIVIAKTVGLASVGLFSVASNLVLNMNNILSTSLNVLNPRFTRLHAEGNTVELKRLFRSSLFLSSTLSCGMGLMLLVFGERFIVFWVGPSFLPAVPILHILTVAYVFALAQSPSWNLMFALAKHHYMARVTIAEAAAVLVLGLWLSRTHGAVGFAWATGIALVTTKVFLHPPYAARIADLSLAKYLAPMAIPFVVSGSLLTVALLAGLPDLLRERGLMSFFLSAGTVAVAYGFLVAAACRSTEYSPVFLAKFWARSAKIRLTGPS